MGFTGRGPSDGAVPLSFDAFLADYGLLVWFAIRRERARRFHGGDSGRCPQRVPPLPHPLQNLDRQGSCHECVSAYLETALVLWSELCRALVAGDRKAADQAAFLRARAKDRFRDTIRRANHQERGHLTRVHRTVHDSAWIDQALNGDEQRKWLLEDLIRYVQSDDPPEPSVPFPYGRLADRHGLTEEAARTELGEILDRLLRTRPAWVDEHVFRPLSEKLASHGGWDETRYDPPADHDQDSHEHGTAACLLDAAARSTRAGCSPARALHEAIRQRVGPRAARRALDSPHWPALVAYVATLASHPEGDEPGAA